MNQTVVSMASAVASHTYTFKTSFNNLKISNTQLTTYHFINIGITIVHILLWNYYQKIVSLIFEDMAMEKVALNSIFTEQNFIESNFLERKYQKENLNIFSSEITWKNIKKAKKTLNNKMNWIMQTECQIKYIKYSVLRIIW